MPFPTPTSFEPVIFLQEGVTYIVPTNGQQGTYSIFRKAPNSNLPLTVFLVNPGDTVTYKITPAGASFFIRSLGGTFNQFIDSETENGTDYLLYAYQVPHNFSNVRYPDGLTGVKFWGKLSGSFPWGWNPVFSRRASIATAQPNLQNRIFRLVNRINTPNTPDFVQSDNLQRPIPTFLTASGGTKLPVTSSRLTLVSGALEPAGLSLLPENNASIYQYVGQYGYHIFGVFHVTSMSNGIAPYRLFSDGVGTNFGVHFTTSSLSNFSPDNQFCNVVFNHMGVTQSLTASMNALHFLEANFQYNTATSNGTVYFRVDDNAVSSSTNLSLAGLTTMKLGTSTVPISSGSTTFVKANVTASADLVEIVFATTKSYDSIVGAVRNYFGAQYEFGTPIVFKTPAYLVGQKLWIRTSPTDFVTTGSNVSSFRNKLIQGGASNSGFDQGDNGEAIPIHTLVDVIKPLTGVNFSGSGLVPSLESAGLGNTYIHPKRYQVFAALRTNSIATAFTGSDIQKNEQIFGSPDQNWGLFLRSGSTPEIIATHLAGQTVHTVSGAITLGQPYFVDLSFVDSVGLRLKINNQTEVTASGMTQLEATITGTLWLGMSTVQSTNIARKVNTDVFELAVGDEQISDPERSLIRQYFLDRYSITGS